MWRDEEPVPPAASASIANPGALGEASVLTVLGLRHPGTML